MKIVLTGPKSCGKTTIGRILAEKLGLPHFDTDRLIENEYEKLHSRRLTFREICEVEGENGFRQIESRAVRSSAELDFCVVSTGGMTLFNPENRSVLRNNALLVYFKADPSILWNRIDRNGIPSFLNGPDAQSNFFSRVAKLDDVVLPYADILFEIDDTTTPEKASDSIRTRIEEEFLLRSSRFSTLGEILQIHTFGESHGPAIGAVIDGIPSGIPLSEEDIQTELDRRRPGQSQISTRRNETDKVTILSGVFEGKTTGTSLAVMIGNRDSRSGDYEAMRTLFRPGHADFTFWAKYGFRDHRGGGRSSGRETAARVAGGAVAKKILSLQGIQIRAYALEIAGIRAEKVDYDAIEKNPVRSPDSDAAIQMEQAILKALKEQDSVGGIIQLEITGVPAGLGDPVFAKLDARLGGAFFSVGAVKGVEFGAGFAVKNMKGSRNNDPFRDGVPITNHAGGILGGISTGEPIIARIAVKPTPSIAIPQETCDTEGRNQEIRIVGRHDPCVVPRIIPVIESMAALVLLDCRMIQERIHGFHLRK